MVTRNEGALTPVILTIAGFDPSSGAGITADLRTIQAHGCLGMACITALTVQNASEVSNVEPVSGQVVSKTLCKLTETTDFSAIKVGMLGTSEVATAVADFLADHQGKIVVLDPILRSSAGPALLDQMGIEVLKARMVSLASVITPNLPEAGSLTGLPVSSRQEVQIAARRLQEMGTPNVVITGGHAEDNSDFLLTESGEAHWIEGDRLASVATHGTGCAYSTSLACNLALGMELPDAAIAAKAFVIESLRQRSQVESGN